MRYPNLTAVAAGAAWLLVHSTVAAQPTTITWFPDEVIDAPVEQISSASGVSVLWWNGAWYVVYEKSGDIHLGVRDGSGWQSVPFESDPAASRNPHIAATDPTLSIVWEDERSGQPEVWGSRSSDGASWTTAECLSCANPMPSVGPVIDADGVTTIVAWTDDPVGASRVTGRRSTDSGSWGLVEPISESPARAFDPSVTVHPGSESVAVVWTDTRHGDAEIYARSYRTFFPGWEPEQRLTDLPGACGRPSAHAESCCPDIAYDALSVVFENDQLGVNEVYGICTDGPPPLRISPDDGVASESPNFSGFLFVWSGCTIPFGLTINNNYVTWIEADGANVFHHSQRCFDLVQTEPVVEAGLAPPAVGGRRGDPDAELMLVWIEEVAGAPTLLARRGTQLGCYDFRFRDPPASFLIAPGGEPANELTLYEECGDTPAPGAEIYVDLDPALVPLLDPTQGFPPFTELTGPDGVATFHIYGGGCSQAGSVSATCFFDAPFLSWNGVRSPDIDGNCYVDGGDIDYVIAMLGTDDFCADLDGSGLVDAADRAIVEATFGHRCPSMAIADPTAAPGTPAIAVAPNPARTRATILVGGAVEATAVRITDVLGRRVRDLGPVAPNSDGVDWDLRDTAGARVPSGMYYVLAETTTSTLRQTLLVIR